jgi:hypothetical protein
MDSNVLFPSFVSQNQIGHFAFLSLLFFFFFFHIWELQEFALFSNKKERENENNLFANNVVFHFSCSYSSS